MLRNPDSPFVLFHIFAGTILLVAGIAALLLRKGSRPHRMAGRIFTTCMVLVCLDGTYLAAIKADASLATRTGTMIIALTALYLAVTGWAAARRDDGETGWIERIAMLGIFTLAAISIYTGQLIAGRSDPLDLMPPPVYYVLAGIAAWLGALDISVLVRGGLSGRHRIARHLWRMCFAFFFAAAILFVANDHIFPQSWRDSGLLRLIPVAIIAAMLFWLVRVLFTRWWKTPHDGRIQAM